MTDPFPELPRVRAPEFPEGLDWIGVDGAPPRLAALRGRIVLLDFWSYGCINCIHVAAQLRELERRFPRELVVIGVHSGKHPAERVTTRIHDAARRLGVTHPVVNDRQFRVWRAFAVDAWPTLVLVDPQGYVVGSRGGERTADELTPVVARLVAKHSADGTLRVADVPHRPADATPAASASALRYPTKVAVHAPTRRLAIADSANHRLVVGTLRGEGRMLDVDRVVGAGVPTWARAGHPAQGATREAFVARADGPPDAATFDMPQGVAFDADARWLYVADAGNHAVRAVDVATGDVRTIAGTGVRVRTAEDRRHGALASPWDVVVVDRTLFVAMAGTHQLWAIDLDTETARPYAGGRGEALIDGPRDDALLAQPMGLGADARGLWFADAESSAVRVVEGANVRTLVGTGLFDFGDRDGVGDDVRLQHAQAVAPAPDGRVLVVDAYNDALKWLEPASRRVDAWLRDFHEPAGVALAPPLAYVADTNAHRIVVVDLETGARDPLVVAR
jgi:DNA-binding beta-propeller fold protein YncE